MKTPLSEDFVQFLMKEALGEAAKAAQSDEVPVGCVVACEGKIVARSHNLVEQRFDPTAHAEILALREAGEKIGNWRLNESVLCVTLEPCTMCIGAIRSARVPTLIFGAADERLGACGSLYDLSADPRLGNAPRVISGILATESTSLLRAFFKERR